MINAQRGYLLGIGSNIEPHNHISQIIYMLVEYFGEISLSRVIALPPIGINSQHEFLNTVVFVATTLPETELKQICNAIEIKQGRDRNDPRRKFKDRPADLDILCAIQLPEDTAMPAYSITDEYFLYPLIDELLAYLAGKQFEPEHVGIPLKIDQLVFGQTATTINRNTDTRDKRVL